MKAQALMNGNMVVCPDGNIGVIEEINIRRTFVKFGSGGPIGSYYWKDLRKATKQEIHEAGLEGVGYRE